MRVTRIVSALVAMILAATLAVAFTSPGATGAAKPPHDLIAKGKEIRNTGRFVAYGKVSTYKNRKITIQRKLKGQSYRFYKKTKTSAAKGRFRTGIDGPIGSCFKVVVPSTNRYRTTKEVVGCIVKA